MWCWRGSVWGAWLLGVLLGVIPVGGLALAEDLTLPNLLRVGDKHTSPPERPLHQDPDLTPTWGEDEGLEPKAVGEEVGRSCGSCGGHPTPSHSVQKVPTFPHLLGVGDKLGLLGTWKVLGIAIPILVLQIITLGLIAYLLKNEKKAESTDTGTGYYAPYPGQESTRYGDSYSGYRSLVSSEEVPGTVDWVVGKVSGTLQPSSWSRSGGSSNNESKSIVSKISGSVTKGSKGSGSRSGGSFNKGSRNSKYRNSGALNTVSQFSGAHE